MSNVNKALVRRAVEEVWNGRNYAVVEELVASDFIAHSPPDETNGVEDLKQFYGALHQAFPDLHFTIEDQIAEGDRVVTRWSAGGTHTGELMGTAPTGQPVHLSGIDIDRVANGKIVECWFDAAAMLQQLGVVPQPAPAG